MAQPSSRLVVTFRLFSNAACTAQVFTTTNALPATSEWFTPAAVVTYYWSAVYDGDATTTPPLHAVAPSTNRSRSPGSWALPRPSPSLATSSAPSPSTPARACSSRAPGCGAITVNPGGALTIVDSQISRGIVVTSPSFLSTCNSQVSGPPPAAGLSVTNAAAPIRIGDPATGCVGNRFGGQVVLTANPAVTFGANIVSGSTTVNGDGPGDTILKANAMIGSLGRSANSRTPTQRRSAQLSPCQDRPTHGLGRALTPEPGPAPARALLIRLSVAAQILVALFGGAACANGSSSSSATTSTTAVAVVREILATNADPPGAPGRTLTLVRYTIAPGAQLAPHTHPGVQLAAIEAGTLTYTVLSGTASLKRADGTIQQVTGPETVTLEQGDEVTETGDMVHFGANKTNAPVVILASLLTESGRELAVVVTTAPR